MLICRHCSLRFTPTMMSIYLPHLVVYIHVVTVTPIHNSLALFQGLMLLCMLQVIKNWSQGTTIPSSSSLGFFSSPLPLFSPPVILSTFFSTPSPSQIHQVQFGFSDGVRPWLSGCNVNGENAVRTCRSHVHGSLGGWEEEKRNIVGRLRKGKCWGGGEKWEKKMNR